MHIDNAVWVFAIAGLFVAAASFWVMRAMVRAGAGPKARLPILAGAAVLGLTALGAYLAIGSPLEPARPAAVQRAEIAEKLKGGLGAVSETELLVFLADQARKNPADPKPLVFSGQINHGLGRYPWAELDFQAALRRDPEAEGAHLGLGRAIVAADRGKIGPRAEAAFAEAARRDSEGLEAPFYLTWAAVSDDRPDAEPRWRALVALVNTAPDPLETLRQMARTAVEEGGEIGAFPLRLLAEVKRRAPRDPIPYFYEGLAASEAGRFADAERLWGEVLARLPPDDRRSEMASQMRAQARAALTAAQP